MTVGAVGPPGSRVFYLQARQADQVVTFKLEKQQVLFLAGGLSEVLADLASPAAVPAGGELDLEEPVDAEWAVGSMQLAYDADADRVVLVARELSASDEEGSAGEGDDEATGVAPGEVSRPGPVGGAGASPSEPEGADEAGVARLVLTREQAAAVIEHGKRLLRSGRPPCPLCGFPLSDDHSCPKTNGHHAPSL